MGYEEETPEVIKTFERLAWGAAVLFFAAICGLVWIAYDAKNDVEVITRIEAEAAARKQLTPLHHACVRQLAAGETNVITKPYSCAPAAKTVPANAMTVPVSQ